MLQLSWQADLAAAFTRPEDLLNYLEMPSLIEQTLPKARRGFPFRVTRSFAARMRKGDAADPLLRQVLPLSLEEQETPGFLADPVGDLASVAAPGVLHKYRGRALLIATGACAIHCRYCFRREFPYADEQMSRARGARAMDYIRQDSSITEVILSGGDPLVLSDERLEALVASIAAIPHIMRLRLHSRLPVVLPSRITGRLLEIMSGTRLRPVLVIHANHPNEIDQEVNAALGRLRTAGVTLLNQSVLLRGVNDSMESLAALSEALFAGGVLPYYLHTLDKAQGTAHFEVPVEEARALHERLRRELPGYLVPKLVREEAGQPYKTLL